jgi:hypothetical protein
MSIREYEVKAPHEISITPAVESGLKASNIPLEMRRLDLLLKTLSIKHEQLRGILSKIGDVVEGSPYLHPRDISHSQFSNWLAGREKMPLWRLAQCLAVLEAIVIEQRHEAISSGEFETDDPTFTLLDSAETDINRFVDNDEVLRAWLDRFRVTWRRILKEQSEKGPVEAKRYDRYAAHLHKKDIGTKVDERHANKKSRETA